MVGTANETKSAPLSTSKRLTALTKLNRVVPLGRDRHRFTPAAVSAGDVVGERQAAFHNGFALTPEGCRSDGQCS